MTYRVDYTDDFLRHIEAHVDYLRGRKVDDQIIEQWYEGLFSRIDHWVFGLAATPSMNGTRLPLPGAAGKPAR